MLAAREHLRICEDQVRLLIVEEQALVREGLRSLLDPNPGLDVVGEVADGMNVSDVVERLSPDVVIIDVTMNGTAGLDTLQSLKRNWPGVGVLVLTSAVEERCAIRCLRSGADGFLTHSESSRELIAAIQKVARGGKYLTQDVAEQLAASLDSGSDRPAHEVLSDREYQVMCLIAEGRPPTKVAEMLGLSVKTVSTYRTRILKKLDLKNTAEIMRYAISNQLVE